MHLQTGEGCGIPFPGLNRAELKYVGYIHLRANHVKEGDDYNNWRFRVSKTSQNNNMKNILMIGISESSEYLQKFHGLFAYSWIVHQKRSHKEIICREMKKAKTDPEPRTKSSRRGAPTGAGIRASFSIFGSFFLRNRQKMT